MAGEKTAAQAIFSKSKITKPVSARPPAFKIICLFVKTTIYDDQQKVSCPSWTRQTNKSRNDLSVN